MQGVLIGLFFLNQINSIWAIEPVQMLMKCGCFLFKLLPLCVVDSISKPWRVHYSQFQLHSLLLNVHCVLCNLHCLMDSLFGKRQTICTSSALCMYLMYTFTLKETSNWWLTLCIEQFAVFMQICQEQTVYQGGFAQARLTCNTVNHNTDASMRLLSSPQGPKMYHYCVVQKHTSSKTILNVIWVSSPDRRTTDGIYTQYKWDLQNQVFFSYSLRNMSIMLKMCTIGSAHLQP